MIDLMRMIKIVKIIILEYLQLNMAISVHLDNFVIHVSNLSNSRPLRQMVVFPRACNFGHFLFKIKIFLCFFLFENASSVEIKQETAAVYPGRSPAAGTTISCV